MADKKTNRKLFGVIIGLVIIAFVVVLLYKNLNSTTITTTVIATTTVNASIATTSIPSNTLTNPAGNCTAVWEPQQDYTNNGGGPGNYYMSKQEVENIFGLDTTYHYCATGVQNGANAVAYLNDSILKANNVISLWAMSYLPPDYSGEGGRNNTNGIGVSEIVFQSSTAKGIYGGGYNLTEFANDNSVKTIVNATESGMTYSFMNDSESIGATSLVGFKGNYEVSVTIVGKAVPAPQLASVISADLP